MEVSGVQGASVMTENRAERRRTLKLRASAAPLNMICPASAHPQEGEVLLDSINPAGIMGTAAHEALRSLPETGDFSQQRIIEICEDENLTPAQGQEISMLCWAGKRWWDKFGNALPFSTAEYAIKRKLNEDAELSGHMDVLSLDDMDKPTVAQVPDWKSTRLDLNYTHQMLCYALLVCLKWPSIQRVTTAAVFLRDDTMSVREWTRQQVVEFRGQYEERVVNWNGQSYTAGGHCSYCRRFVNCPALKEMNRSSIDQLGLVPVQDAALPMSPATVDMYQRVKALSTVIDRFNEMVRATVEQAGGELPGSSGQSLKLVPSSKPHIDAKKAWPVILGFHEIAPVSPISNDDLAPAVEIGKGKLLDIVAEHATKGQKGKVKAAMTEALEQAGALTKKEFSVLRVVQTKEIKELQSGE